MASSSCEWQTDVTFASLKPMLLRRDGEGGTGDSSCFFFAEGAGSVLGAGKGNNCFNLGPSAVPGDTEKFAWSGVTRY